MNRKIHYLKTWPFYFEGIIDGSKTFEIRVNDRDFGLGDVLVLQCFDPRTKTYDGREETRIITYILDGVIFHDLDCCVLGMKPMEANL